MPAATSSFRRGLRAAAAGACIGALVASPVLGYREGPLPDRVGACDFVGPSCADLTCHDTFLVDQTQLPWTLEREGGPATAPYVPGRRYQMTLRIDERPAPYASIWGFELAPLVGCPFPVGAGDLTPLDAGRTRRLEDRGIVYLSHSCTCPDEDPACCGYVPQAELSLIEWSFLWDAPAAGTGDVTFSLAMNAANWDGERDDDRITLAAVTVPENIACPPPVRDLRVTREACDATGLPALRLSWSATGAAYRVRAVTDLVSASPDRAQWAAAPPTDCQPMPPEPLVYFSVAEDCPGALEGAH